MAQTNSLGQPTLLPPAADNIDEEILKHSVTQQDHLANIKRDGAGSVFYFNIPTSGLGIGGGGLFSGNSYLPTYWSHQRDRVLRATVHFEGMWADVVGMWLAKIASQTWELKGQRIQRYQELLLNGWGSFIYQIGRDFLTTDNGCFFEIVRASTAAGSRILGILPLDSCRTTRTGDPEYPAIFQDKMGYLHALRAHEVCMLADMPSSANTYYGTGLCAASRSFDSITTLVSIEQLVQEKTSGSEPTGISFVNASVNQAQLEDSVKVSNQQRLTKGYFRYMGVVVVPLVNLDANPTVATIELKSLPEGFKSEEERENCQRRYALSLGLDPQMVNPRLIGSGSRGTSAQSRVLNDEQQGLLPSYFKKELAHLLNEYVTPPAVTFYFGVRNLDEEKKRADINNLNANTRSVQIASGEITPDIARRIAVEQNELPAYLIEKGKIDNPLSDADKSEEVNIELTEPIETIQAQPDPKLQTKEHHDTRAIRAREAVERALGIDAVSQATLKSWKDTLNAREKDLDFATLLLAQERANAQALFNAEAAPAQ